MSALMSTCVEDSTEPSAPESDGDAMSTVVGDHHLDIGDELADLLDGAPLYVRFTSEHQQWYAEAKDFQLVGIGPSRAAAVEDMCRALKAHLRYSRKQGRNAREARQSSGMVATVSVRALVVMGRIVSSERRPAIRMRLRVDSAR